MLIIVALFVGLTISAEEIFKDQKILKREKDTNSETILTYKSTITDLQKSLAEIHEQNSILKSELLESKKQQITQQPLNTTKVQSNTGIQGTDEHYVKTTLIQNPIKTGV